MFEIIFLAAAGIYFLLSVVFFSGAGKRFKKYHRDNLPAVSLIVCARNEEENILACLNSLDSLSYPVDKLEIIIADDNSTDSTGKIADDFISGKGKFKKIIVDDSEVKLKGKTRALSQAIKISSGEIIITTDADCVVPLNWVEAIVSYYSEDVAAVCGFTYQPVKNWFSGMQSVDLIYLLTIAAGAVNISKPVSCIGNNMSYRKNVYVETGGYEKLPFSVTEDFLLLKAINNLKKYKILFPLDPDLLVETSPCKNLKEVYHQKKRWAVGGLNASAWGGFVMFTALLANYCLILTPLFFSRVCLYLAVFKLASDFFLLYPVHKQLGKSKNLKYFIHFQIYYIVYVITIPWLLLFNRRVKWKGREY